ncbi:MAG: ATP-dependent DNA ligase, partial [Acidimicrobiia bacterium]
MLFEELARASDAVAATSKRSEKVGVLAAVLERLPPDEIPAAVAFAAGTTLHGRLGVGWATLRDVRPAPATEPTLTVGQVDRALATLTTIAGAGSQARRREVLHDVLAAATEAEQRLLVAVIGGELRQGALDGVVAAAVAKAAGVAVSDVQRGAMFAGSLPVAARVALVSGRDGLAAIGLTPSTPVQPMLAAPAVDVADALGSIDGGSGAASVEWKLDGTRVQAHRSGGDVRLYTRNLNDVTDRLGGVVEVVRSLPGGDLVLDGEVLGLDADGAPRRFQDTMGDFGAETVVSRGSGLQAFFFDVLHAGSPLVDEPLSVRRELLASTVPESSRLPSIVTADVDEAQRFLDRAIAAGHEGVMVKDLAAPYEAGRRGGAWRKVKPVHTFDLVVLAVEWGHGRRQGWLSNLHLGARDDGGGFVPGGFVPGGFVPGGFVPGGFVMVGKTFKGLTDELLRWQTERFLALEIGRGTGRDAHVVHVRP